MYHVYWQSSVKCVSSFSVHSPDTLKEAPVPIISTKKCNSSCMYNGEITPRVLCAGYTEGKVDACQVRCMFWTAPCRGILFTGKHRHNESRMSLHWKVFGSTFPGRQWGSSGLPGWKCVEVGRGRQLGDRLCRAQPSWSLHQGRWILGLDLRNDWSKKKFFFYYVVEIMCTVQRYSTCTVLYFNIFIWYYFILALQNISEKDSLLFTPQLTLCTSRYCTENTWSSYNLSCIRI